MLIQCRIFYSSVVFNLIKIIKIRNVVVHEFVKLFLKLLNLRGLIFPSDYNVTSNNKSRTELFIENSGNVMIYN